MTWRDTTAALLIAAAGIAWAWLGRVPLALAPFAAVLFGAGCLSFLAFVWTLGEVSEQPHREFSTPLARWFPGLDRIRRRRSLTEWAVLGGAGFVLAALCLPAIQSVPRSRATNSPSSPPVAESADSPAP
jgi:hypothetical protein